jgi:D-beta-D-heptose 7-phosphate kinase/D-beta-D-heptose 1-phosphate adenosyltransferase
MLTPEPQACLAAWDAVASPNILVLGDLMLDRYSWGTVDRISPEAPIPVLKLNREEERLGGAGNVVMNLKTLGCTVSVSGLIGNDSTGNQILAILSSEGLNPEGVQQESDFPTVLKHRMMAGQNHLLRLDHDPCSSYQYLNYSNLIRWLETTLPTQQALVISDYNKGTLHPSLLTSAIQIAKWSNIPVLVDPRNHGDYEIYDGCSLIKPNRKEASAATGILIKDQETALKAAEFLQDKLNGSIVALSLDKDGLLLFESSEDFIFFGTEAFEVFDVVGAGDMVISILSMLISSQATPAIAAHWAQLGAAMEIQHVGVVSFEREEIRKRFVYGHTSTKIVSLKRLQRELQLSRYLPVVITNGYFDKLSSAHLKFLGQLREFKGFNIVAINSDASIQRKKGEPPLLDEMERARLLASLQSVDRVLIFDEDDCCKIFQCLKPEIVVKGDRYQNRKIEESNVIQEIGARVKYLPEYTL